MAVTIPARLRQYRNNGDIAGDELIAVLEDLIAEIEALETRVETLEGAE
jgi:hypothetical protein